MKLYFAWVEKAEKFNPEIHEREDEYIFNLKINQREGGIAIAQIEVLNPKHGLLQQGRYKYCYISYREAQKNHLLFKGALIGMPIKIDGEVVCLQFTSASEDHFKKLQDVYQTLKKPPFFDELFMDEHARDEPVEALEARPALYYFCRKTGDIRLSGFFEGTSHIDLGENFYRDSLKVEVGQAPLCAVDVVLSAQWKQQAEGYQDLSPLIEAQFPEGLVNTLTGKDLTAKWWKAGERIGHSAYWIEESELEEVNPPSTGGLNLYPKSSVAVWQADEEGGEKRQICFKRSWYKPTLKIGWNYRQKRQETLNFTLNHLTQNLLPDNQRRLKLKLSLQNIVGENHRWRPLHSYTQGFNVVYMNTVYTCLTSHISADTFESKLWQKKGNNSHVHEQAGRSSFFLTDRGFEAFKHAVEIARTHLAASARAITIKIMGDFEQLHHITTDHTVTLQDDRLPGGTVTGKVIGYNLQADGKTGRRFVHISLGVAIGLDQRSIELPAPVSEDGYVEAGFCTADYQVIPEEYGKTISGIIYKHWYDQQPTAGVLYPYALTASDIVCNLSVENNAVHQNQHIFIHQYPKCSNPKAALREIPTDIRLEMLNLSSWETLKHEIFVDIPEPWSAPQHINLQSL
ncbi:MAG: hypothetical protein IBJ00_02470 [Alphaproteobacteria bacterium]|nr:hypothetical protein [Alphaproteobacteria bacterium]